MRISPLASAFVVLAAFTSLQISVAVAEDNQGCFQTKVTTVPSRPSFSNGAATTQCGVAEIEYGWNHQWPGAGSREDSIGGGLRFGITPKLDFHWSSDSFLNVFDGKTSARGFGDTWLGFKYRFHEGARRSPALGILYMYKVPSASEAKGLGSGYPDHAVSLLVSKDVRFLHFDFNVIELLAGRGSASAFDHSTQLALSASAPVTGRWGATLEDYGASQLSSDAPAFASAMFGLTYQVNRRMVLDGGLDVGLTHAAPQKRIFFGITYAIKNLYAWMAPAR